MGTAGTGGVLPSERCNGERTLPRRDEVEESRLTDIADWDRYEFAAPRVQGLSVIDCACGAGYGSWVLAKSAARVIGLDISTEAINWARKEFSTERTEFRLVSDGRFPVESEAADAVVSFETLEHMDEAAGVRFISECARVLKRQGMLILSTPLSRGPDRLHPQNRFHIREYDDVEARAMVSHDFEVLEHLGQHSGQSKTFATWRRGPLGMLLRTNLHRLIPPSVRDVLRGVVLSPAGRQRTTISDEDRSTAPVQILIGAKRIVP